MFAWLKELGGLLKLGGQVFGHYSDKSKTKERRKADDKKSKYEDNKRNIDIPDPDNF